MQELSVQTEIQLQHVQPRLAWEADRRGVNNPRTPGLTATLPLSLPATSCLIWCGSANSIAHRAEL
jgi:hypothetical protein